MAEGKCPGQGMRMRDPNKVIYYVDCETCGDEVEFFYDDKKRKCSSCNEDVQPDLETLMQYHNCASSCASAKECLGADKFVQLYLSEPVGKKEGQSRIEKILNDMPDEEIKDLLKEKMDSNLAKGYLLDLENDIEKTESEYIKVFMKKKIDDL